MEFYNRTDLSELFETEHDLSDLLAGSPEVVADWIGEEDLTLVGREQAVLDVRADILFRTSDDRLVEVEVQLSDADDRHLGQINRHLSQIAPSIFVWVAQSFDRQTNKLFREWNARNERDCYAVEIHGVEGTGLLGWSVVEEPYTIDRDATVRHQGE